MLRSCKYLKRDEYDDQYCQVISEYGISEMEKYYNNEKYCVGDYYFQSCPAVSLLEYVQFDNKTRCKYLSLSMQDDLWFGWKLIGHCSQQHMIIEKENHIRSCCRAPNRNSFPCGFRESQPDEGCFISSACIMAKGLPDDCEELETLRTFRDNLTKRDEKLANLCRDYYKNAPEIVKRINQSDNMVKNYEEIYNNLVSPCVTMLKNGSIEEAIELYTNTYMSLLKKYNIVDGT